MPFPYEIDVPLLSGETLALSEARDRVLLLVNTASHCGFTPHYGGLQALHQDWAERGLLVVGFPCNQFGAQEPGAGSEIQAFCADRYAVDFPLAEKIEVNGAGTHPLFAYLKQEARGLLGSKRIKWNFTKFLVGRGGSPIRRFAPQTKPAELRKAVEGLLG